MYDSDDDDEEQVDDQALFNLDSVEVQSWESKDRKVATLRMKDEAGLSDMKILLTLRLKVHQLEAELGIHGEDELCH